MNDSSQESGSDRKSNTWKDESFERSIQLNDVFGDQNSTWTDDDSSKHIRASVASAASSARQSIASASSAGDVSKRTNSFSVASAASSARRSIASASSAGDVPNRTSSFSVASAASSARRSIASASSAGDVPKRTSSFSSAASSSKAPGSPQHKLRQRKSQPAAERIRRPSRSINSSSQSHEAASAAPTTRKTPQRSNSYRTIHRSLSMDSTEGIPKMPESTKIMEESGHSSTTAGRSIPSNIAFCSGVADNDNSMGENTILSRSTGENTILSRVEEGTNASHQASFFQEEPEPSSSSSHNSTTSNETPIQQPSVTKPPIQLPLVTKPPAYTKEPPRTTWCISCALFLGLMTTFVLMQVFSILIWKPIVAPVQQESYLSQLSSKSGMAQPLTLPPPPEQVFEGMEESVMGHLPKETLHAITRHVDSPQSLAFVWFHSDPHWETYSQERRRTRFALATLYFATNPPHKHLWKHPGQWLSFDVSECEWNIPAGSPAKEDDPRNMCRNGVVTSLSLKDNNLHGRLPPELSLLTTLESVNVKRNAGLSGELPQEWCQLSNLQYDCAIKSALTTAGVCGCGQCVC